MTYFKYKDALHATTGKVRNIEGIEFLTKEEYEDALEQFVHRAEENLNNNTTLKV